MKANSPFHRFSTYLVCSIGIICLGQIQESMGSSHREAPAITGSPKLDGTDFYMFRSYEPDREDYVTFLACYQPLQDPYGGPNYYPLDPHALYEIHIDNNGDTVEDITFQFRPTVDYQKISLPIGADGDQKNVGIPLAIAGQITAGDEGALNVREGYSLNIIRGDRRDGASEPVTHDDGQTDFVKPLDYVGQKTFPDYSGYANQYIYEVSIPGCTMPGRVFVGQRRDPFVVNLGETFDLINIANPVGPVAIEKNDLADKNVTLFAIEVPIECVKGPDQDVIGAWTTASSMDPMNPEMAPRQVSRLGQPLVNEVVIGLNDTAIQGVLDKDAFNAVEPAVPGDAVLIDYVTHPTLPALVEILFGDAGVVAPTSFPRNDLVTVFLTGIEGLNMTATPAEYLRLNLTTEPVPAGEQNNLGVLAGDNAGFPNGRRPGDDVVDIALRVVMGALLPEDDAPSGGLPFTDGAYVDAAMFDSSFPYARAPIAGSPGDFSVSVLLESAADPEGPFQPVQAVYDEEESKLVTPRNSATEQFFRLQTDGPVELDSRRIETVPNIQVGIRKKSGNQ